MIVYHVSMVRETVIELPLPEPKDKSKNRLSSHWCSNMWLPVSLKRKVLIVTSVRGEDHML